MVENTFEKRKKKVWNWLKKPNNFVLVAILVFAFAIRLYYFILTKSQPLWWDEASYGSLAKNLLHHAWDNMPGIVGETVIRPPLFPLLWAFLVMFGLPEVGVRFILEFIPSVLAVFFVYLAGKELYNKRIGLIAAFIFSVLWIHLFYTCRLLTNVPALPFIFLSVYYFVKATKGEFNAKWFAISLILLSISSLIRYPNGLIFFVYLLFLIIMFRVDLVKKSSFWISGFIGLIPMFLFFIYNFVTKGNIFPAVLGSDYITSGTEAAKPIAFGLLKFIRIYLGGWGNPFLIFFLVGIGFVIFELVVGYDLIRKRGRLQSHLFLLLLLVLIYAYFVFYLRVAEDRWLFATSFPLACLSAFGFSYVYGLLKKYQKTLAAVVILVLLAWGAYAQVKTADPLIKSKAESFLEMRQGFEWIKENTPEDAIISGSGIDVYSLYYAERIYNRINDKFSVSDTIESDYVVIHAFTPHPSSLYEYLSINQDKWSPVMALFFDKAQTEPAFVVYRSTINV